MCDRTESWYVLQPFAKVGAHGVVGITVDKEEVEGCMIEATLRLGSWHGAWTLAASGRWEYPLDTLMAHNIDPQY